jgi:hypothetical protein
MALAFGFACVAAHFTTNPAFEMLSRGNRYFVATTDADAPSTL